MAKQFTGKVTIRIDGQEYKSLDGATLNPGGVNRSTVKGGGRVHGFTEEDQEPTMDFKLPHNAGVSLKRLGSLTDATVMFETDSGVQFITRGCYTTEPPSLSGNEVDVKMAGVECDELV